MRSDTLSDLQGEESAFATGAVRRAGVMLWLTSGMAVSAVVLLIGMLCLLSWLAFAGGAFGAEAGQLPGALEVLSQGQPPYTAEALFSAVVGTITVTLLMTLVVAPLGILVAVYLHVYAGEHWYTDLVRVGIHNLAGVPSIIYGVFGLGFFVYWVGAGVDEWFFSNSLPRATFGTPGILWAAITLALLTLPTVIVSVEEGLLRLPASLREGSFALGATRFETVVGVLLPATMTSVVTGVILAVARATGEVAPLMLVGVVKYAPSLPVSVQAPFIHLEQKFMHLGYLVYDLTLHAPAGDGRIALIAVVALSLVLVTMSLTTFAAVLRGRFRYQYAQEGLL